MSLEKELTKATKVKPPKGGWGDRQDELAALARTAAKLGDDDFDELSTEAADWVNAAVQAINNKTKIEEFEDADGTGEADNEQEPEESAGGNGDADDAADEAAEEAEAEAAEAEAEVAKAKPKAKAKAKRKKKDEEPEEELEKGPILKTVKTRYDNITGEMDRFGVMIGTKTHDAVMLYEKGTTSKELMEKVGGRHYNILARLEKAGHLVERTGEGVFTVTHKDDIDKKKAAEKAAKKTKK